MRFGLSGRLTGATVKERRKYTLIFLPLFLSLSLTARVEAGQRRVLDEATRQRRLTRQLEALEKDNFQVCVHVMFTPSNLLLI